MTLAEAKAHCDRMTGLRRERSLTDDELAGWEAALAIVDAEADRLQAEARALIEQIAAGEQLAMDSPGREFREELLVMSPTWHPAKLRAYLERHAVLCGVEQEALDRRMRQPLMTPRRRPS